ncbi:MAG: hypothetical protein JWO50_581 [Candidatus Kaiserbacteria bacterium]|nr:hypothetical protein [Candidatus Kaiserbacteria bacterium]
MFKILIVEDLIHEQDRYAENMPNFELLQAFNFKEASEHFHAHQNELAAIVLDGKLSRYEYGHALAASFREQGYRGPMLATSSDEDLRRRLMHYGCDHSVNKDDVPDYLRKLLA